LQRPNAYCNERATFIVCRDATGLCPWLLATSVRSTIPVGRQRSPLNATAVRQTRTGRRLERAIDIDDVGFDDDAGDRRSRRRNGRACSLPGVRLRAQRAFVTFEPVL
jgi:hypothetical protein